MNNHESISPEQLEEIERLLHNEMQEEERQAFFARLSADAGLKKTMEEIHLTLVGVQEPFLRERLEDFHKEIPESATTAATPEGKVLPIKKWLAAASIILVLAFSGWWFFLKPTYEERLFAKYFQPEPGLISAMSTSDNYLFDRAMIDYKTGNYEAAIKTWDSLQTVHPNNDTLNYFLGSAYLVTKEADKAIGYLQKVAALPNSFFVKDANWYAGLALLKEGRKEEAISFIEKSERDEKAALLLKLRRKL